MKKQVFTQNIRSNIWKLTAIQALTQALFAMPIFVLYFQSFGLTLTQIFLLQAIYSVAVLMFEIPTGYIADKWGRKNTITTGCIIYFLGYLAYALSSGFWSIMFAEIIIGLASSFLSGSIEAMTYDSLLEIGEEKRYRSVAGNQHFLQFNTEAVSALLGGLIAAISLRSAFWMTLIPMGLACILCCTLQEPKRHKLEAGNHLKAIIDISAHTLFHHKGLRSIVLLYAVVSSMTLSLFWFTQPYQSLIGVPIVFYGFLHALIVSSGAFASKIVPKLQKAMDDRILLLILSFSVVACFLFLSLPATYAGLALFLIARIAWGFLGPLTADIINRMADSSIRATVLSLRSFANRIIFVCTSPFLAMVSDAYTIPYALGVGGIVGCLVLLMIFFGIRNVWSEIPA